MATAMAMREPRRVAFNPAFREANRTRARYRVLCGSAGSGKSFNTAQDFLLKLSDSRFRGANLLVVRKAETACRLSTFAELCGAAERIFGDCASRVWQVRQEPMELFCPLTGSRIVFRGMKDAAQREKLKSVAFPRGKLCWIWMEEATEFLPEDLELLDDRLRGELSLLNPNLYYQITLTFNPVSAAHWLKKRFFDRPPDEGEDGGSSVFLSRTVFGQNRFLDPDYARRMERRRLTDPEGYRVYALGEWGGGGQGLILPEFRVEHLPPEPEFYDSQWLAQDFGFHHADCLLQLGTRDGEIYVLRELYVRGLDTGEIIARAAAADFPRNLLMYCDAAEPDRIRTWRRAGFRAVPARKGAGSVAAQIEFLRAHPPVIDASCENVLSEIREWHWLRDEVSGEWLDEPCPIHDDAMAALRYGTEHLRARENRARSISKSALGI